MENTLMRSKLNVVKRTLVTFMLLIPTLSYVGLNASTGDSSDDTIPQGPVCRSPPER